MGYELYRQLANRRHRRKRPKGPEFDMEEDNQSKNILEGRMHFMLGRERCDHIVWVHPVALVKNSILDSQVSHLIPVLQYMG